MIDPQQELSRGDVERIAALHVASIATADGSAPLLRYSFDADAKADTKLATAGNVVRNIPSAHANLGKALRLNSGGHLKTPDLGQHDAVSLEGQDRPTAVIVTTEFLHEAEVQRAALGMDDLKPVVITHPLSTLSDEEIAARAADAAAQATRIWLGTE